MYQEEFIRVRCRIRVRLGARDGNKDNWQQRYRGEDRGTKLIKVKDVQRDNKETCHSSVKVTKSTAASFLHWTCLCRFIDLLSSRVQIAVNCWVWSGFGWHCRRLLSEVKHHNKFLWSCHWDQFVALTVLQLEKGDPVLHKGKVVNFHAIMIRDGQ